MKPRPYVMAACIALSMVPAATRAQTAAETRSAAAADVGTSAASVITPATLQALHLPPATATALADALRSKDLPAVQRVLLAAIPGQSTPHDVFLTYLLLGDVYFQSHDPLQAAVAWQKAAKLEPLPTPIRFSLAMAYVQLQRSDWADTLLLALHREQPGNPIYPFWLGRIRYDMQHYSEAADWFRAALRADPGFVRAHDNLGLCLYDMNDVRGAVAEYHSAIRLQQGKADATAWPYLNLGNAEEFRGDTEAAIAAYRQAIAVDPRFDQPHYYLGMLLLSKDRLAESATELQAAVALRPDYLEAHAGLARVYRRQGLAAQSRAEVEICNRLRAKKKGDRLMQSAPDTEAAAFRTRVCPRAGLFLPR